jgi:hypothetical protein
MSKGITHTQRRNNTSQFRMVNNILCRIWTQGVIDRDGEETSASESQIGDLPFRSILRPKSNTVVLSSNTKLLIQGSQTSAKVDATNLNISVSQPGVWSEGTSLWIARTPAKTLVFVVKTDGVLKHFMHRRDLAVPNVSTSRLE